MVSVAEQFSNLRTTLGSILGIFTLLRYLRTLLAKLTGRPPPVDATSLTPSAFASFQGLTPSNQPGAPATPSRRPFIFFLLAVFGLPYLMSKLIRSLAKSAQAQQQQLGPVMGPDGQPLPDQEPQQPLDPSKLDFCRVLYDYPPTSSPLPPGSEAIDLSVKKGDLVAVISKIDPMGQPSEWWRCRARDGRMGYLPGIYLEIVQRRPQITEKGESRASTMSGTGSGGGEGSRANSLKVEGAKVPVLAQMGKKGLAVDGKGEPVGVESFQSGGFYS